MTHPLFMAALAENDMACQLIEVEGMGIVLLRDDNVNAVHV